MEVKFIYFQTNLSDGLINSPFKIIIIIKKEFSGFNGLNLWFVRDGRFTEED